AIARPAMTRRLCGVFLSLQPQQLAGVAGKDALARAGADVERFDRRDGFRNQAAALLGIERRIGGEQAAPGAEEGMAALRCRRLAIERRVGIEHAVVIDRRTLERGGAGIAIGRTEENLAKAEADAP